MPLKVAVQMDHVSTVNIAGDTSFALSLEAQRRGHQLFHYTPDRLSMRDGKVFARIEEMQVRDVKGDHFTLGAPVRTDLSEMDVILLRQDPPFDMNYITTTHILERIHPKTLVVNDPAWVRNSPEKIFVTEFADLMPETLITKDPQEVAAFRKEFGDIIVKPLYGNGGAGIFHLHEADRNLGSLLEMFGQLFREPYIVQRYLKDVRKGDKRIILIDGEPVGAINRVPSDTESRSNMHVGGRAEKTELTAREREICARIGPALRERGFILVGIDVIGDYMTEINVTSPTGIREVKRFGGADIAALFWDAVEAKRVTLKTYTGSCHCGAVRFEADVDIAAGTGKCNCTICTKMRLWSVEARAETFRLVAGESELTDYQGKNDVAHHFFCKHCGVRGFERVDTPNMTGATYFNINVACLDGVDIDELMAAPVTYRDGRNDDWGSTPAETRHL